MPNSEVEHPVEWSKAAVDLGIFFLSIGAVVLCNEMREKIAQDIQNYHHYATLYGKAAVDAFVGSGSDLGNTMMAFSGFRFLKHTIFRQAGCLMDALSLMITGGFVFLELGELGNPKLMEICNTTGNECGSMLDMAIYAIPTLYTVGPYIKKMFDGPQIGG